MTDAEVLAAIRANHLKANIGEWERLTTETETRWAIRWDEAFLDPGGTIFGPGPYAHVPIDVTWDSDDFDDRIVIRVYPPERLRKRLAAKWVRSPASPASQEGGK